MRPVVYLLLLFSSVSMAQNSYQKAEALFNDNQFIQAKQLFNKHLSTNPQDLKTIEYLGDIAGHYKQWDEAIGYYKTLVDLHEDNANYHFKYGGVLGMKAKEANKFKALGMVGDIKNEFLTAARLDPNYIDARWALVKFYIQLPRIVGGSESEALIFANELEGLSKVDGLLAKGYIAENSNRYQDAEAYYKKAIELGGSITCYQKLTNLYEIITKEPAKAINNIEEAQSKYNRNVLHYQIGKIAAEYNIDLQKGESALFTYIKNYSATDETPKGWAYYRLAQIYKYKGNRTEALKYIDLAISDLSDIKPFQNEKKAILNM